MHCFDLFDFVCLFEVFKFKDARLLRVTSNTIPGVQNWKEHESETRMTARVLKQEMINSVILNLLCVWILIAVESTGVLRLIYYLLASLRERDRQTDRQTETETDRDTHTHTHTHTYTHTHTHTHRQTEDIWWDAVKKDSASNRPSWSSLL